MLRAIKPNRIWQIVYPLFVYYIFYNLFYALFSSFFEERMGHLFCLMLSGILTLLPEVIIYRKVPHIPGELRIKDKREALEIVACIIITIAVGIILNIIISQTSLLDNSAAFSKSSETLTDGSLLVKIACNAIIIPALEEVLYRGIIAGHIYIWHGALPALVISAFCFGILHFNIVQFLYAFLVGLMLTGTYLRTKKLWVPMMAHGLINLIVIIFS